MILASLMSCGMAPSLQYWQRTSCNGNRRVVLQCLIRSGESHHYLGLSQRSSCLWWIQYRALPWQAEVGTRWHQGLPSSQQSAWSRSRNSVPPTSPSVVLVCNNFPSGGFKGGCLVLHWSHCLLDAILHPSDVPCNCCWLDGFTELCPVLIGAASGDLLSFAPGSPETLQISLAGWPLVLG